MDITDEKQEFKKDSASQLSVLSPDGARHTVFSSISEVKDGGILVTAFPKNQNKRYNSKKIKTRFREKL